jgi:hypothetical protein
MIHDVSVPAALVAGLVSFLSPCVLPLVPPYLIYLTGATIEHVSHDESARTSKRAVMLAALTFVLGDRRADGADRHRVSHRHDIQRQHLVAGDFSGAAEFRVIQ